MAVNNYLISDWVVYRITQVGEQVKYKRVVDLNLFFKRAILPLIIIGLILILTGMWWGWANDYMDWAFKVAQEASVGY